MTPNRRARWGGSGQGSGDIPEPYGGVPVGGGDRAPVRAEGDVLDHALGDGRPGGVEVSLPARIGGQDAAVPDVKDPDHAILGADGQHGAPRVELQVHHRLDGYGASGAAGLVSYHHATRTDGDEVTVGAEGGVRTREGAGDVPVGHGEQLHDVGAHGEQSAVRAERDPCGEAVTGHGHDGRPGCHVPDLDHPSGAGAGNDSAVVEAGDRQLGSVRAERDVGVEAFVAGEGRQALPGGRIPQEHAADAVVRHLSVGDHESTVGTEGHDRLRNHVSEQAAHIAAGRNVPEPDRLVEAGCGEHPAVRAERERRDIAGMADVNDPDIRVVAPANRRATPPSQAGRGGSRRTLAPKTDLHARLLLPKSATQVISLIVDTIRSRLQN